MSNRKRVFILLLITAGLFLCLEGGTRVYLHRSATGILVNQPIMKLYPTIQHPEEIFSSLTRASLEWSPYEHWVTRPNLRGRFFRTNALGFRGPETTAQKPAGRFRIVVLGSSAAWGLGCTADARTVPGRLESLLREQHPGHDIEVINAGQFGFVSGQELIYYHRVISPLAPDLVLLFDGYNDLAADFMNPVSGWPQNAALLQARYEEEPLFRHLGKDLSAILRRSRVLDLTSRTLAAHITARSGNSVQPVIDPTTTADQYVRNVTALARLAAPVPVWIALQPLPACTQKPLAPEERGIIVAKEQSIPRYTARVQAAYRAMDAKARAAGLPVIDLERALGTEPALLFVDECHFGDEAADRIAAHITREWSHSNALQF